ncbi:glycosyltransferase [Candidatus Bipolaricaulota bacterium]|nr:glycosyltransferase [Candidatus Bipolaricaulota bacterium]
MRITTVLDSADTKRYTVRRSGGTPRVAPPEKLVVVRNGIDPMPFLQASGTGVQREPKLEVEPVLIFLGRLAPQKDLLTLLKAFERIPVGRLVLVGEGPSRSQVEQSVERTGLNDRVTMLGARTDIPELLAASDLFVLPSRWEGLPLTIIEAMMAGLPVVASHVGGVAELVEDGVTGFLVPSEAPAALAEALRKLLEDSELRKRMGKAGREKALQDFTLDRMLAETKKEYDEVLGGVSE